VHLLRVLPDRHRKLIRELVSFSFAGMVNTAFGFLLFNLLFSMGSLTANAISTAGGTATSFVLNRHITYRHRPRRSLRHELPLFAAVNLIGLGIQQAVMAMAKVIFDLQSTDRLEFNLARVVSVIVGTVFLLLSYRSVVFRKARAADLADDVAADLAERAATKPAAPAAPAAPDIDEFNELTVPLEAELSHDLDMPADLELDDLLPAKPSDRPSRS
jgi:putative flippase GtrA